jgi:tRNA wybutosine-synthesizing protein 1
MIPEVLEKMKMPTQLYVSVDAPNKKIYSKVDRPVTGKWENLIKTLELLPNLGTRTVLRLTLIRNMNMSNAAEYAQLITMAQPKFVELKAYMAVGFSRQRLGMKFMPLHSEVKDFAREISKFSDYKFIDEKENSRVVLMMQQDSRDRIMKF